MTNGTEFSTLDGEGRRLLRRIIELEPDSVELFADRLALLQIIQISRQTISLPVMEVAELQPLVDALPVEMELVDDCFPAQFFPIVDEDDLIVKLHPMILAVHIIERHRNILVEKH